MRDVEYNFVGEAFNWCIDRGLNKKGLFSKLKPGNILCDVLHAKGLIENGGFHYFFSGFSRRQVLRIIESHELIGLHHLSELIRDAYTLFIDARRLVDDPSDVDKIRAKCEPAMSRIEHQYYDEADTLLFSVAAKYVRANFPDFKSGGQGQGATAGRNVQ